MSSHIYWQIEAPHKCIWARTCGSEHALKRGSQVACLEK